MAFFEKCVEPKLIIIIIIMSNHNNIILLSKSWIKTGNKTT